MKVESISFLHFYIYLFFFVMQEWNGRLKIELSAAIKSPCIQYQLMGSKKVQQELARPGALEKFIASKQTVCMLRALFADQYSLDLVSKHFHFFFLRGILRK